MKESVTTIALELNRGDILHAVKRRLPGDIKDWGADARVYFRVPPCGDYSGVELEISDADPIRVVVTVVEDGDA